ncbi:hypothetical protein K523DRAFT_8340 [Schizophyllum commune Tattone D]|nr:hypothetical protein K523DRAFT_8340 [Schizophyllum commune Tattone D]
MLPAAMIYCAQPSTAPPLGYSCAPHLAAPYPRRPTLSAGDTATRHPSRLPASQPARLSCPLRGAHRRRTPVCMQVGLPVSDVSPPRAPYLPPRVRASCSPTLSTSRPLQDQLWRYPRPPSRASPSPHASQLHDPSLFIASTEHVSPVQSQ